jgi:hypothetical protein
MSINNVPTYFQKISKPLAKLFETKQFHKSSYTIPKGLSNERCGERVKMEINVF